MIAEDAQTDVSDEGSFQNRQDELVQKVRWGLLEIVCSK